MVKFCQNCNTKLNEEDIFCKNCGAKITQQNRKIEHFEKQIAYPQKPRIQQPYTYNQTYNPYYNQPKTKPKRNRKKIIAASIITIIIAIMLITTAFIITIVKETEKKAETEKLNPVEYGPKASFHSLSGGSITSIPQKGATAKYGLYDENGIIAQPGEKIGQIYEKNYGPVTFQEEKCLLIKTNGTLSIPMDEYIDSYTYMSDNKEKEEALKQIPNKINYYIESEYYIKENDYTPIYMEYKIDMSEILEITKKISRATGQQTNYFNSNEMKIGYIIDWNRKDNNADMRLYMKGISYMEMDENYTLEFSEGYWDMSPELDQLYVGFEKIVNFTMKMKLNDYSYSTRSYVDEYPSEEKGFSKSREESMEKYETSKTEEDYGYTDDKIEEYTYSIDNIIKFNVVDQEDLHLSCGDFKDCYVLEIEQQQKTNMNDYSYGSTTTTSTKIWINENGVMPKAEYSILGNNGLGGSSSSQKLMMILEEYTK